MKNFPKPLVIFGFVRYNETIPNMAALMEGVIYDKAVKLQRRDLCPLIKRR